MRRSTVIGGAALIFASFLSVFAFQVHDSYRRTLAEATSIVAMITQIASDHAYRSLGSVQAILERTMAEIALEAADINLDLVDATLLREIAVLDAQGVIVRSTIASSIGSRPLDDSVLQQARAHPNTVTFGPLANGRSFGDRGEQAALSRRHLLPAVMAMPSGAFVAVAVNPDYFADVYTPIAAPRAFSIALLSLQGVVVGASAGGTFDIGSSLAGSPPFDGLVFERQSGPLEEAGGRRLEAFRSTPVFPFITLVSVPRDVVLKNWREQTELLSAVQALVLLVLLAGAFVMARQIDASRRQQQSLATAEQVRHMNRLLTAIVDAPLSLTAITTPDLGIVSANARFLESLDCNLRNLGLVLRQPAVSGADKIFEYAGAGPSQATIEIDLSLARGNGRFVQLRFQISWHAFPDIGDCLVLVGYDETERRTMEIAIAQSAKLITLGEMATGMAHEINQPLNVIKMAAQSCRLELEEAATPADTDGPAAREFPSAEFIHGKLRRIEEQVDRAAGIIAHMRIFGRAPTGRPQTIDARAACDGAAALVREQLRAAGIDLVVAAPGEPLPVSVHQNLIEQVIINLVLNARDAMVGAGRRRGEVRLTPVRAGPRKVAILVSDDGPGIPQAVRGRLFEPFFTTKPPGQGLGLGLAISFGIVKDCGGSLTWTDDTPGATFRIELPAAA